MPTHLKPNPTRFSFQIPGVPTRFSVTEFSVTESISLPFQLDVKMTSKEDIPFEEVMNRPALLTVSKGRSYRYFHGIINRFVYTEKNKDMMVYQASMVPSLWLLSLTQDCRVFQDKSVVEIVQSVLSQHPLSQSVEFRLKRNYPPMDFCAQFQESNFDFISRLLEEEGIFYFFEHSKTKHTLVLADDRLGYLPYQDNASVVYSPDVNENPGQDGIEEFLVTRNMHPGKVTLRDYDFQAPNKNLTYQAQASANQSYEVYHYPGRYKNGYGKTLAQIHLQEMTTFKEMAMGKGSYHRFTPGKWFRLTKHEQRRFNRQFLLTDITHNGYQPPATMRTEDESRRPGYFNDFVAIPASVRFTPSRTTLQPRIDGPQTAVVTGPPGEEIHTDEHGRVKVQFHWARNGSNDEKSSSWVRVSQSWAGAGHGTMFLPRIGEEVIVEFLNGDLRQPVIVGRLYNGEKKPPHSLPGNKTISTIKTASSIGGGGSNELRFEDKKGAEEIYLHAENDLTIEIENDKEETIGTAELTKVGLNRTTMVGKDLNETIAGNKQVSVGINQSETIGGQVSVSAGKDWNRSIGGNLTENVSKSCTLNAKKIIFSAKDEIKLNTGKASIVLDKSGDIRIKGKSIMITGSGDVVIKGKKVLGI
jgi:type VI secretion system secreted protein VgrG